ncbi:DUF4175 family protein [Chondrinema litorale]|uniref:DUF4175 family protein n=1 Tax=Chondrinema litorale TaxID=2994555 RepID=UPI002543F9E9|nr:DUF4175 family protein [Chondrinema litorale]UZR94027.1 DUF4175 family protein [Chondrinema litorale]
MMQQKEYPFKALLLKWRTQQKILSIGIALLLFLPVLIITYYLIPDWYLLASGIVFAISIFFAIQYYKKNEIDENKVANFLDEIFPETESSGFLFLKNRENLNLLETLQVQKIEKRYAPILKETKLPVPIAKVFASVVIVSLVAFAIGNFLIQNKQENAIAEEASIMPESTEIKSVSEVNSKAELSKINIQINPPVYTKIPAKYEAQGNAKVPQFSKLTINLDFTGEVNSCELRTAKGKVFSQSEKSKTYQFALSVEENMIYQIVYKTEDGEQRSDYYKIEIIEDRKPDIFLADLPQYQSFAFGEPASFNVKATIRDDYGLSDAYLIATISKGSGESVKFREEKISLKQALKAGSKTAELSKKLDLYELEAGPGDELYYYLEVLDNRAPEPLKTRTETYFAILNDTSRESITVDSGLGADFMPAYFRSQRQLIIDTEKLIAQRGKISKEEFDKTSNNIGYDQKVLRLRYGEFLGEEAENSMEGGTLEMHHDEDHHDENMSNEEKVKSLVDQYSHLHDTQSEMEKNLLEEHNHKHGGEETGDSESEYGEGMVKLNNGASVSEDMMHTHDSADEATFYFSSTKAQLKAALALMWESELQLRMNEPEKALPIEYKILDLLKEVQQKSRIYVERIGFEPPPIKEAEKRLKGELDDIISPKVSEENKDEIPFEGVKQAIAVLEIIKEEKRKPFGAELASLEAAGNEIAPLAIENPSKYLGLLKEIKEIQQVENVEDYNDTKISNLQAMLLNLLPEEFHSRFKKVKTKSRLTEIFNDQLQGL